MGVGRGFWAELVQQKATQDASAQADESREKRKILGNEKQKQRNFFLQETDKPQARNRLLLLNPKASWCLRLNPTFQSLESSGCRFPHEWSSR